MFFTKFISHTLKAFNTIKSFSSYRALTNAFCTLIDNFAYFNNIGFIVKILFDLLLENFRDSRSSRANRGNNAENQLLGEPQFRRCHLFTALRLSLIIFAMHTISMLY